jgi:hypothetical protein
MNPRYAFLGACMLHVEGYYSTKSLAFKNRNPGNIEDSNGKMRVFESSLAGFICLLVDINANAGKTLAQFLSKYAPPSENDTNMYVSVVSTLSGIKPDEVL